MTAASDNCEAYFVVAQSTDQYAIVSSKKKTSAVRREQRVHTGSRLYLWSAWPAVVWIKKSKCSVKGIRGPGEQLDGRAWHNQFQLGIPTVN